MLCKIFLLSFGQGRLRDRKRDFIRVLIMYSFRRRLVELKYISISLVTQKYLVDTIIVFS